MLSTTLGCRPSSTPWCRRCSRRARPPANARTSPTATGSGMRSPRPAWSSRTPRKVPDGTGRLMAGKKGPSKGTGGHGRRKLEGRGPTPPAKERPRHPAARRARGRGQAARPSTRGGSGARPRRGAASDDVVAGRNAVVEALRASVPAKTLYVAVGLDATTGSPSPEAGGGARSRRSRVHPGPRWTASPVAPRTRASLSRCDRSSTSAPMICCAGARGAGPAADRRARRRHRSPQPRCIARSATAFGAHGLLLPERRAVGVTPSAWKASAGTLARLPVARVTTLVRTLTAYYKAGLTVVGLAADGPVVISELNASVDPMVLVIGSEGRGLSRLVAEAVSGAGADPDVGARRIVERRGRGRRGPCRNSPPPFLIGDTGTVARAPCSADQSG